MLGILSDSHGNLDALTRAAAILADHGVTEAVHCGDIDTEAAVTALARLHVHWVFGNCDLDTRRLERAMRLHGHECHGWAGEVTVDGRRVAFTHGHRDGLLRSLLESRPDYLLHGHTHERRDERIAGVRVLNPGALYRARPRTIILLDSGTDNVEWLEIAPVP